MSTDGGDDGGGAFLVADDGEFAENLAGAIDLGAMFGAKK